MQLSMQASQVVGLSNDKCWSQTYAEDNLIIALELVSDGSFSAKEEGDIFLKNLAELLKRRKPQDKEAFKILVSQYITSSLIQNCITSLIVGMFLKNEVFLFAKSKAYALIKRGNLWSELIAGDGFTIGTLWEKDILIFLTESFKKLLPYQEVIEKFSDEDDPIFASEKIGAMLHNFDDSKGAAAIFAQFKSEILPAISPEITGVINNAQDGINEEKVLPDVLSMQVVEEVEEIQEVPKEPEELNKPIGEIIQKYNEPPPVYKPEEKLPPKPPAKENIFMGFSKKLFGITNNISIPFLKKTNYAVDVDEDNQKSFFAQTFSSPRQKVLLVALILTLVLAGSIILGINQSGNQLGKSSAVAADLATITRKIEEGEALTDLNALRSKTLLSEAEKDLITLRDKYKKGTKERIQAEELLLRVQNVLATVTKIYKIDNPAVFLDLTIVKNGAAAQNFSLYENKLAVLDNKNISIFSVNIDNLSSAIVGGGSKTPSPTLITDYGSNIFVLTSDGLVKLDIVSKSQQVVIKNLKNINSIAMTAFAGNIYLLDGSAGMVYKIMALESGYSDPSNYLASGEKIGLSSPVDLAIDGSVWVLGDNSVKKFTRGTPQFFNLEVLDNPLNQATNIFTNDSCKYLYIFDKGTNRVVVFDKEGKYFSQYIISGITNITDIAVSEKVNKIFLLTGSLIYSIDLR